MKYLLTSLVAILSAYAVNSQMARATARASGESMKENMKIETTQNGLYRTKHAPKTLPKTELASFAAGCFWGVEQEFRKEKGVLATAVGFMGGHTKNPTYEDVCNHDTGHAETVQVEFDPKQISYEQLLEIFWNLHDPTTLNRQGPDIGDQYRSAVFFHSPAQKSLAESTRHKLQTSGELNGKIVTEINSASVFYKAEEYHQQYVEKGGRAGCHLRKAR
jgi:peptide-methionine (S)-S-oxide reductase